MRGQIRRYPLAVHANQAQAADRGTGRSTHAQAAGATSDRHRFWSERVAGAAHEGGANLAAVLRKIHRSEEHTSELQSLMRISYAVICWTKTNTLIHTLHHTI